jgi:hypothetical protein
VRNDTKSSEASEHHDPSRRLRRDGRDLAGESEDLPVGDRRFGVAKRRPAEVENERRQRISCVFADLEGTLDAVIDPIH